MEIVYGIIAILISGFSYSFGFSRGARAGFYAREYHNPVVVIATTYENTFIAHDFTDKSFLAQADSMAELGEIMKNTYPDKTIVIAGNI